MHCAQNSRKSKEGLALLLAIRRASICHFSAETRSGWVYVNSAKQHLVVDHHDIGLRPSFIQALPGTKQLLGSFACYLVYCIVIDIFIPMSDFNIPWMVDFPRNAGRRDHLKSIAISTAEMDQLLLGNGGVLCSSLVNKHPRGIRIYGMRYSRSLTVHHLVSSQIIVLAVPKNDFDRHNQQSQYVVFLYCHIICSPPIFSHNMQSSQIIT